MYLKEILNQRSTRQGFRRFYGSLLPLIPCRDERGSLPTESNGQQNKTRYLLGSEDLDGTRVNGGNGTLQQNEKVDSSCSCFVFTFFILPCKCQACVLRPCLHATCTSSRPAHLAHQFYSGKHGIIERGQFSTSPRACITLRSGSTATKARLYAGCRGIRHRLRASRPRPREEESLSAFPPVCQISVARPS